MKPQLAAGITLDLIALLVHGSVMAATQHREI
jgi:hypothetical protein